MLGYIGNQFRWCRLQHLPNGIQDLICLLLTRLDHLRGFDCHLRWKSAHQFLSTCIPDRILFPRIHRTNVLLQLFGRAFAQQHIMTFPHITDDCLIEIIATNLDGTAMLHTASCYDCNIRRSRTDIHNHRTNCRLNIHTCTDGCRKWFLKHIHILCTGTVYCITRCTPLYVRDTTWHTDADVWFAPDLSFCNR